jgi:hypothetical protein
LLVASLVARCMRSECRSARAGLVAPVQTAAALSGGFRATGGDPRIVPRSGPPTEPDQRLAVGRATYASGFRTCAVKAAIVGLTSGPEGSPGLQAPPNG